jgi:hypothetical protein
MVKFSKGYKEITTHLSDMPLLKNVYVLILTIMVYWEWIRELGANSDQW